jgi:hypothetical protein
MFDNKFWEEIKTKYPKAYEHFINDNNIFNQTLEEFDGNNCKFNFNDICYCDLEKFFDANEIIIETMNICSEKWEWDISNYDRWLAQSKNHFKTRDEAKLEAVKKAFEIMENRLKEKKE